jgi:hypothetical protein
LQAENRVFLVIGNVSTILSNLQSLFMHFFVEDQHFFVETNEISPKKGDILAYCQNKIKFINGRYAIKAIQFCKQARN